MTRLRELLRPDLRGSGYASGGNSGAGRRNGSSNYNALPTLSATLEGAHLRLPGQREISSPARPR